MSIFSFTNPINGQRIEIEGPAGLTEAQARQIFQQQLSAGSLVGLKPGDVIDSATQLAGGLKTAASQLTQAISGVGGSVQGALSGALDQARQAASSLPGRDLLTTAQSVATKTLSGVNTAINNLVPTNPINVANLAKQATSLLPIQGLNQIDVRAAITSVTNTVKQAADTLSNSKGLGQFGLDASQLERAGVLKPGTVGTYLAGATANLTSVLNSPAVWTGVNGITNVDKLLSSVSTQNLIQQDLMNQGLAAVKNLGIPINSLNPQALAGTAINAAKSVTDTMAWAKGAALPSEVKSLFDKVSRDAAFAVDFVKQTANNALLQQESADPAIDTVNRETLDAATTRVTGNDKIPDVNYQSVTVQEALQKNQKDLARDLTQVIKDFDELVIRSRELVAIAPKLKSSDLQVSDLTRLISIVEDEFLANSIALESQIIGSVREAEVIKERTGRAPPELASLISYLDKIKQGIKGWENYLQKVQVRLVELTS